MMDRNSSTFSRASHFKKDDSYCLVGQLWLPPAAVYNCEWRARHGQSGKASDWRSRGSLQGDRSPISGGNAERRGVRPGGSRKGDDQGTGAGRCGTQWICQIVGWQLPDWWSDLVFGLFAANAQVASPYSAAGATNRVRPHHRDLGATGLQYGAVTRFDNRARRGAHPREWVGAYCAKRSRSGRQCVDAAGILSTCPG